MFQREEFEGTKKDRLAEVWAKGNETLLGWNESEHIKGTDLKWNVPDGKKD